MNKRNKLWSGLGMMLAAAGVALFTQPAAALIEGGTGNAPLHVPGWPKGAAVIFNTPSRVAFWVGPPLGGGQYHAECRGDAKALSQILADFAELDVKNKRIILHDGVGNSFWLNPNNQAAKQAAATMDWSFMVWDKESWKQVRKLPADLNPIDAKDTEPPAQLDVYTGGNVDWDKVKVPKGLTIVDNRLESHGFTRADGIVLEGLVTDITNEKPVLAKVMLQRVQPQPKGGYDYPVIAETLADGKGRWVLKNVPSGWHRVVLEAPGYIGRIGRYLRYDDQPRWARVDVSLSPPGPVSGRVTDADGQPLANAEVRLGEVVTAAGRYPTPHERAVQTDKDGRFRIEHVPLGRVTVWVYKSGYVRPGLGPSITTPTDEVALTMVKSSRVEVTVDFTGTERPQGYLVSIKPEGGEKVGSYGGSGNLDDKNRMTFTDVPPARYLVSGQPNPGSERQRTDLFLVDLKGGETAKVTLRAR